LQICGASANLSLKTINREHQLAGFEEIIQRAIDKQQPASLEVREQVYNSARSTLANMLSKTDDITPENIFEQQQRLETAIANIELSHSPAEQEVPANIVPPYVSHEEASSAAEPESRPMIFWRRPFAMLLLGTIVLTAIGIGAWWVYDQELTKPAGSRDNSVPNPPKILSDESAGANDSNQGNSSWLTIFHPADPTGLITPTTSTAVLGKDENGSFVRLKSTKGDLQRSFQLVVEPGVMEVMLNKTAVFEVTAKSGNQDSQQFVITCQFGSLGDCGRQSFMTEPKPKIFSFEKNFASISSNGSTKSGTISILVDLSSQGVPLDIYLIRVKAR
jgi:hypothetical protein